MKAELRSALLRDYKLAIEGYEKQDAIVYFRNLRPAIESLCQLVIIDIMDNNENEAQQLLNGKTNKWRKEDVTASKTTIGGSTYPDIICTLLDIKKIYNSIPNSSERKRAKDDIKYACTAMREAYSFCSNAASHTNVNSKLDLQMHIQEQVWRIPNFINKLNNRGALTKEFVKFIEDELPKPSISEQFVKEYERKFNDLQDQIEQLQEDKKILNDAKLLAETQVGEARQMAEEIVATAKQRIAECNKQVEELIAENEQLKQQVQETIEHPITLKEAPAQSLDTPEETMDDDQIDLIEQTLDRSMLVSGCAGSGKSLIAIKKAQQIIKQGGDVILITYTKSLQNFIDYGIKDDLIKNRVYYYNQWKKLNYPTADYIIVDEIQDFTEEEVNQFIASARKHFFFFGDTAQSIYGGIKQTLSIERIEELTGLDAMPLYNNYRLPRNIAKITQEYVVNNPNLKYNEKIYQNKEDVFPHIIHFNDIDEEVSTIKFLIKEQGLENVGILVPTNKQVWEIYKKLSESEVYCEHKYSDDKTQKESNTLNFDTINPKIMTYHSAKGLQFETVILPSFDIAKSIDEQKAQYVAMTRTYRNLYILYHIDNLPFYKPIPKHLYKSSL